MWTPRLLVHITASMVVALGCGVRGGTGFASSTGRAISPCLQTETDEPRGELAGVSACPVAVLLRLYRRYCTHPTTCDMGTLGPAALAATFPRRGPTRSRAPGKPGERAKKS